MPMAINNNNNTSRYNPNSSNSTLHEQGLPLIERTITVSRTTIRQRMRTLRNSNSSNNNNIVSCGHRRTTLRMGTNMALNGVVIIVMVIMGLGMGMPFRQVL